MTAPESNTRIKPLSAGLLGSALVLVGGISYLIFMDVPWIRSTAIPNAALVLIGILLAGLAVLKKPTRFTVPNAMLSMLFGGFFLVSVYGLTVLPQPAKEWNIGEAAPDFLLTNQDGNTVRLSSFRGKGPVLLVFYRGHW